jgi:large subunit ribosomal protein L2
VALKKLKPVTPSSRGTIFVDNKPFVTSKPTTKRLLKTVKKPAGRSGGKISMNHRGGAVKKLYREVDFSRKIRDLEGTVTTVEYDPNRNAYISLITYSNGVKAYILTVEGMEVGQKVMAGDEAPIENGNALPIGKIPTGTVVHNIEVNPGSGGTLVRSAGTSASILGFDGNYAQVRLPSKEVRLINVKCYATIGTISNADFKNTLVGKAGRNRRKGIRPTVRGMVKAPSAHPHGGGEAKGVIGHIPRDTWGNIRGKKTRRIKNRYNHLILVNRKGRKIVAK